jgi:transketolase
LATDDLAIMRSIPNLTIVAPCDAAEMRRFMPLTVDHPGPIYIRLARGHDPIVTPDDQEFAIGRIYVMREGAGALAITTGITVRDATAAAESLAVEGIELAILHVPTIKPLNVDAIVNAVQRVPVVVAIEEHSIIGGLGSAVAEVIAERAGRRPFRFLRIGIEDVFPRTYGNQRAVMDHLGINASRVCTVVRSLVTGCQEEQATGPAAAQVTTVHDQHEPEWKG